MSGDGTAVAMNKYHNKNPAVSTPSICVIDGDSLQSENENDGVFRLPGAAPESFVFDSVLEAWDTIGGKLSVAILERFENSGKVLETCKDVRRQNIDSHLLFSQVGERLGLVPEAIVSAAFANIWSQVYANDVGNLVSAIRKIVLNGEKKPATGAAAIAEGL
jgi:hypothetical protein